ncbi:MAG: M50 family metallopeptidase [Nanoarchaeota archaeon]
MAIPILIEILNLLILIVVVGFIFSGYIRAPKNYAKPRTFFSWDDFLFSIAIAAPAILIHELAHKFFAIGFGVSATFKIFAIGIVIGIILRLVNSPFLILAPGYVEIGNAAQSLAPLQMSLVALSGPLVNLVLWLVPKFILKASRNRRIRLKKNTAIFLHYTSLLNMWLFIFNMLPIPPLDGFQFIYNLIKAF